MLLSRFTLWCVCVWLKGAGGRRKRGRETQFLLGWECFPFCIHIRYASACLLLQEERVCSSSIQKGEEEIPIQAKKKWEGGCLSLIDTIVTAEEDSTLPQK